MLHDTGWAKINLALHVRRRRDDGYHDIESVFAFADFGDALTAEATDEISLDVTGPFAGALAGEGDNLVLRAARRLREATGTPGGARLTLDKKLPVAAGLGGGSADAAAALRLLARLWDVADDALLAGIAAELGADVPACLASRTVRGEGRGDALSPIGEPGLAGTPLLLVNPRVALATGPVFAGWDREDRGALGDWREGRNDLEVPATALVPEIGDVLDWLKGQAGVTIARMSGSGATCFALFENEAACADAAAAVPDRWWRAAARLR